MRFDGISSKPNQFKVHFPNDIAVLTLLTSCSDMDSFINCCDEHSLDVDINKTKEIIVDPKLMGDHTKVLNYDQHRQQVSVIRVKMLWV